MGKREYEKPRVVSSIQLPKQPSRVSGYMHEKLIHLRTQTAIEFAKLAALVIIAWVLVEKL